MDYKNAVGGLWEEIGNLQLNFLKSQGLKPNHKLLDIGCGSFRGGRLFQDYLNDGNYYAVDKNKELVDAGKQELNKNKKINLKINDNFTFWKNVKFNYVFAFSIFTHINSDEINKCLASVEKVLLKTGKFYATYFDKDGEQEIKTNDNKSPYHYTLKELKAVADKNNLNVKLVDFNHPRKQKMLCFWKKPKK